MVTNDVDERFDSVRTDDEPSPTATRRLLTVDELGASGALRDPLVDDGDGRVGDWDGDERGSWRRAAGRPFVLLRELERDGSAVDEPDGGCACVEREGPSIGSSQSSSKLSGLSSGFGNVLSRELSLSRSLCFGVVGGRAGVFGFVGRENSKSSSQFSVTTLRRTGGAGEGVVGATTVAVSVPPDDMVLAADGWME